MDPLPLKQIAEFAGAVVEQGDGETMVSTVQTDSRTIGPGELFVALRGDRFNGHKFLAEVAARGAAGAVMERAWTGDLPSPPFAILRADDTLVAYQTLAANYRKSLSLKVLAITGSNGKTSTKDFAASIFGRSFRVTKTEGNLNNHIGLPRTILEGSHDDQFAVWELGMNHPGEIAILARIAAPDAAIITNVGVAHLEFMGTREAIAREKGALAEAVASTGFVVLNADDSFGESLAKRTRARVIFAGMEKGSIRAVEVKQTARGAEFTIVEDSHRTRAAMPVAGRHMVQNALLAVAAGRAFGISLEECAIGLAATPLTKARLQIREIHGVQFIDDSYNANPDSMKAALRTLAELAGPGKRTAILGRMFELGAESKTGHREVGEAAAALGIDHLIAIGDEDIARAARAAGLVRTTVARNPQEAARMLAEFVAPGDFVLVKGSRSARTERVLEEFARPRAGTEVQP